MAIPSFSAFHDEGINLEGLLEILSPENNLVLADDMMVSDGNGIILRVSETYEKTSVLPMTPSLASPPLIWRRTAPSPLHYGMDGSEFQVRQREERSAPHKSINHTHKNVMTVGIPLFDANGELKYAVCFNTVSMEQINSIQRNYRRMQDSPAALLPGDRGAADPGHLHQSAVQKRPHAAAVDADAEHCQHPGQHPHHRRDRRG